MTSPLVLRALGISDDCCKKEFVRLFPSLGAEELHAKLDRADRRMVEIRAGRTADNACREILSLILPSRRSPSSKSPEELRQAVSEVLKETTREEVSIELDKPTLTSVLSVVDRQGGEAKARGRRRSRACREILQAAIEKALLKDTRKLKALFDALSEDRPHDPEYDEEFDLRDRRRVYAEYLKYAEAQSDSRRELEACLRAALSDRGIDPHRYLRLADDVRESIFREARHDLERAQRESQEVASGNTSGGPSLPGPLKCTPQKWAALMRELKLEKHHADRRYHWKHSWSLARYLIDKLSALDALDRAAEGANTYGGTFCLLFVRYRRGTEKEFTDSEAGHELTRGENQVSRKGSAAYVARKNHIDLAVRKVFGS